MKDNFEGYAVVMRDISKYFGTFCALDGVPLEVRKGSIHALLGENGAGKSTLMNILYGLYRPDSGEIFLNGQPAHIRNPSVAIAHGVGMVHQHFMLVENFTVAQNIMLGCESVGKLGILDEKSAYERIVALGERYGLSVDPGAKIQDVSVATQQRVEILKALYRDAEILILDEPTAVLTPQEIEELVRTMRNLAADGKTIIIITHKLKEIKKSSDYCTIIRRGRYVDTVKVAETSQEQLANMMVGRAVNLHVTKTKSDPGDVVFRVDKLQVKDGRGVQKVKDFSIEIRRGEILGIAGIDGNGQTELVEAICGLVPCKGTVTVNGQEIQNSSPRQVRDCCVSAIPEDRQKQGLVMDFTVCENLVLDRYRSDEFSHRGLIKWDKVLSNATENIRRFDIRPEGSENMKARSLSGGNQQKVIVAREVSNNPDLLIAVQPTRGLDVGAIEFVHRALVEQRDQKRAILLVSFELDEILDLADRINVLYDGRIVGDLIPEDTDENEVGLLMAGGSHRE